MSATIESTWDFRSNSAPRSFCVYPAPVIKTDTGGGGGVRSRPSSERTSPFDSNNPFDSAAGGGVGGRRGGPSRGGDGSGGGGGRAQHPPAAYGVVLGTERGGLHYRAYGPPAGDGGGGGGGPPGSFAVGGPGRSDEPGSAQRPLGPTGSGSSSAQGGVHPLHAPADLMGAVPGSVTAVVRAYAGPDPDPPISTASPGGPAAEGGGGPLRPAFLLLADDGRGTAPPASPSPGAYAAHIMTLKDGSFARLAAASPVGGGEGGGTSSGLLPPLPRMSCVSYHPACGYVFAAGSAVFSLPPPRRPRPCLPPWPTTPCTPPPPRRRPLLPLTGRPRNCSSISRRR